MTPSRHRLPCFSHPLVPTYLPPRRRDPCLCRDAPQLRSRDNLPSRSQRVLSTSVLRILDHAPDPALTNSEEPITDPARSVHRVDFRSRLKRSASIGGLQVTTADADSNEQASSKRCVWVILLWPHRRLSPGKTASRTPCTGASTNPITKP